MTRVTVQRSRADAIKTVVNNIIRYAPTSNDVFPISVIIFKTFIARVVTCCKLQLINEGKHWLNGFYKTRAAIPSVLNLALSIRSSH